MNLTHKQRQVLSRALYTEEKRLSSFFNVLSSMGLDQTSEAWVNLYQMLADVRELDALVWTKDDVG